jgi:3-oxoacyl-[acyl-carrier protein] reductase
MTTTESQPAPGDLTRGDDLAGKVAVVTGAAAGIGRAVALGLARSGLRLALCDRDAEGLDRIAAEIMSDGGDVLCGVLDVRDATALDAFFDDVTSRFERLSVLVNNAGGTFGAAFLDCSAKGEQALIAENFTSVTHCIRRAARLMAAGGSIINITSSEAHRAAPGVAIYAAMKAAVASLTKSLALELADARIRVNCIAPDRIPTAGEDAVAAQLVQPDMDLPWHPQPWPDGGDVSDAASAVLFLAGAGSRFITGTTLHLDGGNWAASGWKRHHSGGYVL